MKKTKTVLGKGLNSMLGGEGLGILETEPVRRGEASNTIAILPLERLQPNAEQPRRHFDEAALDELAASIRHLGLIQPITVQPAESGHYTIISGERRYRAAQRAGLAQVPVYIRETKGSELLELALVENIQREDLNAIEVALAYQALAEQTGATHEAIAERVGKTRSSISNYLRLLRLPAEIQLGLSQRLLEMGHARALLQVEDPERQMELYQLCISEGLSVREVEEMARAIKSGGGEDPITPNPSAEPKATPRPTEYKALEQHLASVLGTRVNLKCNPKGKGSISIPFRSEEELERLLGLLQRIQNA